MAKMNTDALEGRNGSGAAARFWAGYIAKSALISAVLLYLAFSAEFDAVRAVYEAY